jgi:pimeloyl-ACP methyl ester carboxylesterase
MSQRSDIKPATTEFVVSQDGTRIAFDRKGAGTPVVVVAGAIANRSFGDGFGPPLARDFTAYNYDRRGRNESGDNQPYAVEREVEDIAAVMQEAGGEAFVVGFSSGAVLALEAAASGLPIKKLALYEPPLLVDDSRPPVPRDYAQQMAGALAAGDRGRVIEIFMSQAVRIPEEAIAGMRNDPSWPGLEAVAHTTLYDAAIMEGLMYGKPLPEDRVKRWASYRGPILVLVGTATYPFMHAGARALAVALPNAEVRTLEGQTHDVNPEVLVPVLTDFFKS